MIERLTYNLNEMIRHQRLAEAGQDRDYHHREALRYRLVAMRLEKQIKIIRQSINAWMNLN